MKKIKYSNEPIGKVRVIKDFLPSSEEIAFKEKPLPILYEISKTNTARYLLGEPGKKNLLVFGVNPSTATDEKYDQTIKLIKGYSSRIGFDGWIMANLYPQRATHPCDLHPESKFKYSYHSSNLAYIDWTIKNFNVNSIWCAWGNSIECRNYLKNCLNDIFDLPGMNGLKYFSIGLTYKMHPKHPLRMRYSTRLKKFTIRRPR